VGAGLALGGRIVAALLSFAVLLGSGYAWATYRNFTSNITRVNAIANGKQAGPNIDGADQNILMVGVDDRSNATPQELAQLSTTLDGGSMNTDTMMVMHVPANGAKATVISFPRDSWVNIPGFGMNKLNAAYALGAGASHNVDAGAQLLIQTIHQMTGLTIDHYVQVSLIAFYRISIAIGGVDVCLIAAQNPQTDSDAYGSGYSGINLPAGHSVIEGKQALAFVRQRHGLPRGDLDRIVRQQYFLAAAFRKIASAGTLLNPIKLQNLLTAVSSSLKVDKGLDLLKLATQMQKLTAGNVTFSTIPTSGTPTITYNGTQVSIVQVDTAAMPGFIGNLIGKPADTAYTKATAADPSTVTVAVVNAAGVSQLATRNSAALQQAGFHTGTPNSANTTATTVIEYPAGMESQAKAVAAYVPGAQVAASTAVRTVTLVLGTDGKQVKGLAASVPPSQAPAPASSASQPTVRTAAQVGCIN
jgi:LCP family protein required for cell wall assembly